MPGLAVIRDVPWVARAESRVRLFLPWTRRSEMTRIITMVAVHHQCSMAAAAGMMWAAADDRERKLLAPYLPEGTST